MDKAKIALAGVGVGAGLMYFADPEEGRRRRARVRDAIVHTVHTMEDAAGTASRDVEHRIVGLAARAVAAIVEQPIPTDEILAARVRTRVGRLVSHPGAIDVVATSGRVTLRGPVFGAEVEQLVSGVGDVPGVTSVENRLEPHAEAGDVPALQGPGPLKLTPGPIVRWTPTTRIMAGAAGLALMALASRRRTARNAAVGLAGFELLEQAVRSARGAA
jgi:BON domain-containing protein